MTTRNRDGLTLGASASQPAKLPSINIPPGIDGQLRVALEAMKERLEVREGSRGNPFERAATMRDLAALSPAAKAASVQSVDSLAGGGLTVEQARRMFNDAMATESNRQRIALDTTERNLQGAMDALVNGPGDGGVSALQAMAYSAVSKYTKTQLADDLAKGAATIFSGANSGTTVMELDPAGNYVLFRHRDANVNAAPGGAAYSGMVHTAVGITAAGFIAGFNRQSDGAWQSSVVIDSSTGNVTILGTLKAGSVIEAGATVGLGGTLMGAIRDNASLGASAYYSVGGKLTAQSTYILGGDFSLKTAGFDAGSGLALTSTGLIGKKGGVTTFAIDNVGDATFGGNLAGGGDINITGGAKISGVKTSNNFGGAGAAIVANDSMAAPRGIIALSNTAGSQAIIGYSTGPNGVGIYGLSDSGPAVHCNGILKWGNYTYLPPDGVSSSLFLCGDGTWRAAGGSASTLGGYPAANWARLFATNSGDANPSGSIVNVVGSGTSGIANAFTGTSGSGNTITIDVRTTAPSDIRLKEAVVDIPLGLDFIRQLRPVEYNLIADPARQKGYGFIAQEVELLGVGGSALVYDDPDAQTGDVKGHKVIHYPSYVAVLTKAIQELLARVEVLERR